MKTILVVDNGEGVLFKDKLVKVLKTLQFQKVHSNDEATKVNKLEYAILYSTPLQSEETFDAVYCFINMDQEYGTRAKVIGNLITFGLGHKNTVTASSIEQENKGFVYCLQRYLKGKKDEKVGPQEFPVSVLFADEKELYAWMVGITMALLEGYSKDEITKEIERK